MSGRAVLAIFLLGAVCGLAAGALVFWLVFYEAPTPTTETFKPAVVQKDGSVELMRLPNADPPAPPHTIPKGTREERRITVTVKPHAHPTPAPVKPAADGLCHVEPLQCDPVEVDLSLVRGKDGRRVIASSPDGQVLASHSFDTPILDAPDAPRPNALTVTGGLGQRAFGVAYSRELPIRPFGLPTDAVIGAVYVGGELVPVAGVTFHFR